MANRSLAQWFCDHPRVTIIVSCFASSIILNLINSYAEQSIIDENSVPSEYNRDLVLSDEFHPISNISHTTMGTQKCPHQVCSHIRNLNDGRCPSSDKRKSAQEYGIKLSEHQTWVVSYNTGKKNQ